MQVAGDAMIHRQLKLLIRADAGPLVGTGHVMRMIALGQAWSRLHGDVAMACGDLPAGLIRQIEEEGIRLYQIGNSRCDASDARDTCEIAEAFEPDWIVLDGPKFDDSYQRVLSRRPSKLLVLDDFGHATHQHADLVLNQNIFADTSLYGDQVGGPEYLTGADFTLIRDEFASDSNNTPRRIFSQAKRILISFAGADEENRTLRTLQLLSDLQQSKLVVDCVTGYRYPHSASLVKFKQTANLHLRIHRNHDRVGTLMQHVDLAITDGGSTCYELASCGVPTIVVAVDEQQRLMAASLDHSGAMISIHQPSEAARSNQDNSTDQRLQQSLRQLIGDRELRAQMSELGMRLVDGCGAGRIARRMAARCLKFRDADLQDASLLCSWHNDPEVRSVSLIAQKVTVPALQSLLKKAIADDAQRWWIAEDREGQPVGQVQLEIGDNGSAMISLIVDQARRGCGLGTVLIEHAMETAFKDPSIQNILAQVKPMNVASERAFRNAGFQLTQPTTVSGQLANQFVYQRNWLPGEQSSTRGWKKSA